MTAPALPWRPIAEADKSKTYDLWMRGARYENCRFDVGNGFWYSDHGRLMSNPTHFLEVTPPTADAGAAQDKTDIVRACTCHPDDNPPVPCPQRHALDECRRAAQDQSAVTERVAKAIFCAVKAIMHDHDDCWQAEKQIRWPVWRDAAEAALRAAETKEPTR